jgi:hypothetical protein
VYLAQIRFPVCNLVLNVATQKLIWNYPTFPNFHALNLQTIHPLQEFEINSKLRQPKLYL